MKADYDPRLDSLTRFDKVRNLKDGKVYTFLFMIDVTTLCCRDADGRLRSFKKDKMEFLGGEQSSEDTDTPLTITDGSEITPIVSKEENVSQAGEPQQESIKDFDWLWEERPETIYKFLQWIDNGQLCCSHTAKKSEITPIVNKEENVLQADEPQQESIKEFDWLWEEKHDRIFKFLQWIDNGLLCCSDTYDNNIIFVKDATWWLKKVRMLMIGAKEKDRPTRYYDPRLDNIKQNEEVWDLKRGKRYVFDHFVNGDELVCKDYWSKKKTFKKNEVEVVTENDTQVRWLQDYDLRLDKVKAGDIILHLQSGKLFNVYAKGRKYIVCFDASSEKLIFFMKSEVAFLHKTKLRKFVTKQSKPKKDYKSFNFRSHPKNMLKGGSIRVYNLKKNDKVRDINTGKEYIIYSAFIDDGELLCKDSAGKYKYLKEEEVELAREESIIKESGEEYEMNEQTQKATTHEADSTAVKNNKLRGVNVLRHFKVREIKTGKVYTICDVYSSGELVCRDDSGEYAYLKENEVEIMSYN